MSLFFGLQKDNTANARMQPSEKIVRRANRTFLDIEKGKLSIVKNKDAGEKVELSKTRNKSTPGPLGARGERQLKSGKSKSRLDGRQVKSPTTLGSSTSGIKQTYKSF